LVLRDGGLTGGDYLAERFRGLLFHQTICFNFCFYGLEVGTKRAPKLSLLNKTEAGSKDGIGAADQGRPAFSSRQTLILSTSSAR
jgi:hypothetical protein